MNVLDRRFLVICLKWGLLLLLVIYLGFAGLFTVLFVWVPWMIQRELELILTYGLKDVLTDQALMWTLAGISLVFLVIFEFYTHYRHKRRDLRIGGEFEGRVLWTKGLRIGLLYDVWDFKNYLSWKMGKKKDVVSITDTSSGNIAWKATIPEEEYRRGTVSTWPDPWAIPIGERTTSHYVVYFKRHWWQILPHHIEKLYISRDVELKASFFCYWLPNLNLRTMPHPEKPGVVVYELVDDLASGVKAKPKLITRQVRRLLKRSKGLVQTAILSDAETQKEDYAMSFRVDQLGEKEEAFD